MKLIMMAVDIAAHPAAPRHQDTVPPHKILAYNAETLEVKSRQGGPRFAVTRRANRAKTRQTPRRRCISRRVRVKNPGPK